MLDEYVNEIQALINAREVGEVFTLPRLMGERWAVITEQRTPQAVGRAFSRAVTLGTIRNVVEMPLQKSPRMSLWQRVREE